MSNIFSVGPRTINRVLKDIKRPTSFNNGSFDEYKRVVRRLTTVVKDLYNINAPAGYHVDHKISVLDGFKQEIPAYLIASKENLQVISSIENLKKGSSSSLTRDELYRELGLS